MATVAQQLLTMFVNESPDTDADLDELPLNFSKKNTEFFLAMSKNKKKKIVDTVNGLPLWQVGNQLILVDEEEQKVHFYVRWIEENRKLLGKPSKSQVLVWRSTSSKSEMVARHIFWNYIFKPSGVVMSDRIQTATGKRFWEYRIADSLDLGYSVYGLDIGGKSPESYKIESTDDLAAVKPLLWGKGPRYRLKTLVISKEPLPNLEKMAKDLDSL